MRDSLDNATRELRKVDHLIFVSLKYTRTVDILKHVISRTIEAFNFMIEALLLQKKKKIKKIPKTPGERANLIKELFKKDDTIMEFIQFYLNLRNINRAPYTKSREYRRHVTMTVIIEGETQEITIDKVNEFYETSKDYLKYIKTLLKIEND